MSDKIIDLRLYVENIFPEELENKDSWPDNKNFDDTLKDLWNYDPISIEEDNVEYGLEKWAHKEHVGFSLACFPYI